MSVRFYLLLSAAVLFMLPLFLLPLLPAEPPSVIAHYIALRDDGFIPLTAEEVADCTFTYMFALDRFIPCCVAAELATRSAAGGHGCTEGRWGGHGWRVRLPLRVYLWRVLYGCGGVCVYGM